MPAHAQRDSYLKDCAARFATHLESIVKRDPLQWYNFYPFWENHEQRSKPQPTESVELNARDNAALEAAGTATPLP
jgi:hypothetical protein